MPLVPKIKEEKIDSAYQSILEDTEEAIHPSTKSVPVFHEAIPGGFSHYSKWGKNLYNIWFDERKCGVGEKKKTKLGKSQKHVEKNLFKCPAGPEQCQLVVRDIPGRSAEEEGIHRFRKFDWSPKQG